jgi:hypothetical protein
MTRGYGLCITPVFISCMKGCFLFLFLFLPLWDGLDGMNGVLELGVDMVINDQPMG